MKTFPFDPPLKDAGPFIGVRPGWFEYWARDKFWLNSRMTEINADLFLKRTAKILEINPRDRVIDFGCGAGFISYRLAPRVNHILGIDSSLEALRLAECRCASQSNVSFVLSDPKKSNFADSGPYSLFLCVSVVQYFESLEHIIAMIIFFSRRALPGARMLIADLPEPDSGMRAPWNSACSIVQSFREGYGKEYLRTGLSVLFSDYAQCSKDYPILKIPVDLLRKKIENLGFKTLVLNQSVSICANRPSLLIRF